MVDKQDIVLTFPMKPYHPKRCQIDMRELLVKKLCSESASP